MCLQYQEYDKLIGHVVAVNNEGVLFFMNMTVTYLCQRQRGGACSH